MDGPDGKERRLRKYEASPEPVASAAGDPPLELFSPFGPLIARLRVPDALVERLNARIDALAPGERAEERVLTEALVTEGGEGSLVRVTANLVRRYAAQAEGDAVDRVEFESFWVVRQTAGAPSPVHFHSSDVSGVLYLRLPEVDPGEERKTYISDRRAGYINFLIGGKQRFAKSLVSFKPRVGDFYVFPGWLLHGAEPFRGRGERRSLAFNAILPPPSRD